MRNCDGKVDKLELKILGCISSAMQPLPIAVNVMVEQRTLFVQCRICATQQNIIVQHHLILSHSFDSDRAKKPFHENRI